MHILTHSAPDLYLRLQTSGAGGTCQAWRKEVAPAKECYQSSVTYAPTTTQGFIDIHAALLPPGRPQEGLPPSDYDTESEQLRMPFDCTDRDRLNIGAHKLHLSIQRRDDGMRSPGRSGTHTNT